jgi:CheY-like chemotaxis protein
VARRIRDRLGNRVQLIAITGWGRPEDQSRARADGFDRHLRKPVDLHTLDAFIGSGA